MEGATVGSMIVLAGGISIIVSIVGGLITIRKGRQADLIQQVTGSKDINNHFVRTDLYNKDREADRRDAEVWVQSFQRLEGMFTNHAAATEDRFEEVHRKLDNGLAAHIAAAVAAHIDRSLDEKVESAVKAARIPVRRSRKAKRAQ